MRSWDPERLRRKLQGQQSRKPEAKQLAEAGGLKWPRNQSGGLKRVILFQQYLLDVQREYVTERFRASSWSSASWREKFRSTTWWFCDLG
ncbi:unnamed protein product [Gulo gulo]|uniref:Uncharacterized protein n=1 Tax=Gulo gulo TaxID=48420 RepID=A0A9X9LV93_GULGU|nr:unnamed protein product [Gulo gulo]